MTGSRHERQAPIYTATGIAPDSHRIPSSSHLPADRQEVMVLFGKRNYISFGPECQSLSGLERGSLKGFRCVNCP